MHSYNSSFALIHTLMNWHILFLFLMYVELSVSPKWSCLKINKRNKGKKPSNHDEALSRPTVIISVFSVSTKAVMGSVVLISIQALLVTLCHCQNGYNFDSGPRNNDTIAIIINPKFATSTNNVIWETVNMHVQKLKQDLFKQAGVSVELYTQTNIKLSRDIVSIFVVSYCDDIWNLYRKAEYEGLNEFLYISITDTDCPRLPTNEAITIPLTSSSTELSQLIMDLRMSNSFPWKSIVLMHDDSIENNVVHHLITALTKPFSKAIRSPSVTIFEIFTQDSEWKRRKLLLENFEKFLKTSEMNANYISIISVHHVPLILDAAKTLHLLSAENSWLIIIPDMDSAKGNMSSFSNLLSEGENVSFIYNATKTSSKCTGGLLCLVDELMSVFIMAYSASIQQETELSQQVSEEEWDEIRPSKSDRRHSMVSFIKFRLNESGVCETCPAWQIDSGVTWGQEHFGHNEGCHVLPVGNWNAKTGLKLTEPLFLHMVNGFRGMTLPIATFHVREMNYADVQESGNGYLWKSEPKMEIVYDTELVSLMNHVKTFDTVYGVFDESDLQLLMVNCKKNDKCLITKKEQIKKYNTKIQGVQCLNGLYVKSVVDGLNELTNNGATKEAFIEKTKDYLVYMSRMLSLTYKAKWDAYPWLIGSYIFLDGFVNSGVMDHVYKDRLNAFTVNVKQDLEVFTNNCQVEGYLPSENNTTTSTRTDIDLVVKTLYNNNKLRQVFSLAEQFTTKNLMMDHLYEGKEIVYGKTHGIDLKWVDFSLNLYTRATVNKTMYRIHKWELDLFDNLSYHKLFSAYLHVQTLYRMWLHVKTNLTILAKPNSTLYSSWYSLADPLKEAMTVFGLQDEIYWTVLRGLMDEPNMNELNEWETKTRQTFLEIAERLKLGDVANINEHLLYVGASGDSQNNLTLIANNVIELNNFTVHIQEILKPIDVSFVKMLTNAKTNFAFYSRGRFKNYR